MTPAFSRARRFAVLATILAFILGAAMVGDRITLRRGQTEIGALSLSIDKLAWLEHDMDHGEVFPMPASMLGGMPPKSVHRLSVELSIRGSGLGRERFEIRELFLHSSHGNVWPASGGEVRSIDVLRRQEAHLVVDFDLPDSDRGHLRIVWERRGEVRKMLAVPRPVHHLAARGLERTWPEEVESLPRGDPARGARLYLDKHTCWACHGKIEEKGGATVGPHLGSIGAISESRVEGMSGHQYIYESLLKPDAFIAPACGSIPCATPSAMPPWGELLTLEEMADLVAYLARER